MSNADLIGFINGLNAPPEPAKPFTITSSVLLCDAMSLKARTIVVYPLDSLAYAAAAMTSKSLSRTTGDVFGFISSSSIASRNLRDADWDMKMSEQFLSMMAQS